MKLRNYAVLTAVLVLLSGHAGAAQPAESTVSLKIDASSMEQALSEFAQQTGLQLVFPAEEVTQGLAAPRLAGSFTLEAALGRLLANSGLYYQFINENTVAIRSTKSSDGESGKKISDGGIKASGVEEAGLRLVQADTPSADGGSTVSRQSSGQEQNAANPADRSKGADLEEIVVTAQKREERLQDVPISITVLGGAELDSSSFQGVTDALNTVPGVATTIAGQGGGTKIAVRGVAPNTNLFSSSSPIAYYIDSVPFGIARVPVAPDPSAYDLAQVEVLRGPQGTLYGASALNGVVRVLTRDADLEKFDFKVRSSLSSTDGGGDNYRGDAAVNVPIVPGKLAVRAVAGYENWSGWIDSATANKVNNSHLRNYRLKVNAQPTDDLSIGLSAWRSNNDYGAPPTADNNVNNRAVFPQALATAYDAYGLKATYRASRFSVSSMTGYLDYDNESVLDGRPYGIGFLLTTDISSRVLSEELLISSADDSAWRWSAGVFYRDGKGKLYQTTVLPATTILGNNFYDRSKSSAIFGELGRRFAGNRLEWTLGVRYFHDDVDMQVLSPAPPGQGALLGAPVSDSFNSTTPRAVLSWHRSENLTAYASYSQGFRSGISQFPNISISNPQIPFAKPDKLSNYEIGAKGTLFDRRVTFDAAVYFVDWQDIQQVLSIFSPNGTFTAAIVNGVSASGMGVDFGLTFEPIDALKASVALGWNDLTEDEAVFSSGSLLFDEGERLNGSPEYTAGASLQYTFPFGGSGYAGRWSAAANYTSEQNSTILQAGVRVRDQGDAMWISRTSLSIDAPQHWTASLYVDNLGDEDGAVIRSSGSPFANLRVRPRTMGIQLEFRY